MAYIGNKNNRRKYVVFLTQIIVIMIFASACSSKNVAIEKHEEASIDKSLDIKDMTVEDINWLNEGNAKIIYLDNSKIAKEVKGKFTTLTVKNERDAVLSLKSVKTIMNIEDFSFACDVVSEKDYTIYKLQQLYKNIAVYNGKFEIVCKKDGTPISVSGRYITDIDVNTETYIPKEQARGYVKSGNVIEQELMIDKTKNRCSLIWRLVVENSKTGKKKELLMDALNRAIFQESVIE